ncbi:MAG: hypothetical protein Q4A41_00180 [Bacillota bacterium]|nr:hypothetical protein [Bacillota bacterium]
MSKYTVIVVITIVTVILFAACSIRKEVSAADLGKLIRYRYEYSGGMAGDSYEIKIEKDENGSVFLYETYGNRHPYETSVRYRYPLKDDVLQEIEDYLKQKSLWVKTPFASAQEIVHDGYSYSWSFATDQGYFKIYEGMVVSDELGTRIPQLNEYIRGLKSDSEKQKDPAVSRIPEEDVVGFYLIYDDQFAEIVASPDKSWVSVNQQYLKPVGSTVESLLEKMKEWYLQKRDAWGDQILDAYPLDFSESAHPGPGLNKYAVYLIARSHESYPPYLQILKFGGEEAPDDVLEFLQKSWDLLKESTEE